MEPVCKGRKLSSVETDIKQCSVDRISNLPPELIGNILSLLPTTKEAVATSVLSSRWKWFWTFITRLNFVQSRTDLLKPRFISFVYRVLLHRKPTTLDYFSVSCYDKKNISNFREWVSAALLVDVKEFDLYINVGSGVVSHLLPLDLFSRKKLVKLTLSGVFRINVPESVCLSRLKVLSLDHVTFPDDSLKKLLIGCPALEELEARTFCPVTQTVLPQELFSSKTLAKLGLHRGFLMDVPTLVSLPNIRSLHLFNVKFLDDDSIKRLLCGCPSLQELNMSIRFDVLHIDAPTLSDLTVLWGDWCGRRDGVLLHKIVLRTPSLRSLKVDGVSADSCVLTDLNQLVEAHIGGTLNTMPYQAMPNLIMGISNVKTLYLCGFVMEDIVKKGCELPKFQNLTTLKLGASKDVGWALLPDLLENSPFLERLVFDLGHEEYFYGRWVRDYLENGTWHAPQRVPYCLLHHLKVIQINHYEGCIEEEEMIQYFIENRGGLKDLTIQYSSGPGKLWDMNVAEGL